MRPCIRRPAAFRSWTPGYVRAALVSPVLVPATKRSANDDPLTYSCTTLIRTESAAKSALQPPAAVFRAAASPEGTIPSDKLPRDHTDDRRDADSQQHNIRDFQPSRRCNGYCLHNTPLASDPSAALTARKQSHGRRGGGKIGVSDLRRVSPGLGLMSGVLVGKEGRELRAMKSRPGACVPV